MQRDKWPPQKEWDRVFSKSGIKKPDVGPGAGEGVPKEALNWEVTGEGRAKSVPDSMGQGLVRPRSLKN